MSNISIVKENGGYFLQWKSERNDSFITERLNVKQGYDGKEYIVFSDQLDLEAFQYYIEGETDVELPSYCFGGDSWDYNATSLSALVAAIGSPIQ